MDDRQSAGQAGRAKTRWPRPDGILGRLTYTPAQGDEGIGQLRRNRAKDETPRFKQVTPFAQWFAPARTPDSQPSDMRPSQLVRNQALFLLEYLPEASIDDDAVKSLLLDEISAARPKKQPSTIDAASLFSVGEVADLRESDSSKGHPVLAVASGVSGNVLRLISLARQECLWTEADIRVRVHAPNRRLEGEWCQDAVPISLVKFAIDSRKHDPIKWLLVQNGSSTTLYEPEVRAIPMPVAEPYRRGAGRSAVQIVANPLLSIPCERTGGSLQSDVCFSRDSDADTPRLAIIDQCGCWSLWDMSGRGNARPKVLTPVLKMCGNTISGSIPKLPSSSIAEPQPYKIMWLSLGRTSSRASSSSGIPARSPSEPQPLRHLLLLYSSKALHLFDLSTQRLHPVSHIVLPKDAHRIFGVSPSRLDPSHAFILTSTNLLWVAAKEGRNDTVTLDILVSCAHQKDVTDPTLRLDVSPGAYINDLEACFACVRSARDTEMTTFWFINPEPGTPVRYQRDLVSLRSPSNFVGLTILPAGRRIGHEPTSARGREMRKARLRFFQLLTLGRSLDVHSALCAWSDEPGIHVPPPDTRIALEEDRSRRIKLLRTLTSAFAVPDEFDERAVFGKRGAEALSMGDLKAGIQKRIDFTLAAQRLSTDGGFVPGTPDAPLSTPDTHDFKFIRKAIERESQNGYMPRRSLLDLVALHSPGRDLLELAREWDARQEALHRDAGEWRFVPEARRPLTDFGPDDLVERLRDLFSGSPLSEGTTVWQNREKVLKTMAAEMFLANVGVSAAPQSWTVTDGSLSSSLLPPFPSSPPLMSSQLSLPTPSSEAATKGKEKQEPEPEAAEQGDAVALRLRRYAAVNTSPTARGEPALVLSRWELGADPDNITWKPGRDVEAEHAIDRRRRKIEARRRRAERLSQRILGGGGPDGDGDDTVLGEERRSSQAGLGLGLGPPATSQSSLPTIVATSSQSRPPRDFSSQQEQQEGQQGVVGLPRVFAGSPLRREYPGGASLGQSQLSQGTPSQPKSQVLPGVFGGRPSPFKRSALKKGKRTSELRLSGFR